MAKFEINSIYITRSICDSNCVFGYRVVKRTAKRVTLIEHVNGVDRGEQFIKGVSEYEGVESCYPLGTYSMAPIIRANKVFNYDSIDALGKS